MSKVAIAVLFSWLAIVPAAAEPPDAEIAARLASTFDNIRTLQAVRVEVRAGVVTLSGEVLEAESRELAESLATQADGVVAVENDIEESRSIERRMRALYENLEERGWRLVGFLPLFAIALCIVALFGLLARNVRRWDRMYSAMTDNVFLRDLLRQVAGAVVFGAGVLLALELLGATALVGAVLGFAGVAGLAIGFAFRDLIENYIASVLLSLRQPFAPNDHVIVEGHEGKVVRLTSRATVLLTFEGNHVRIPNATVFKGTLVNFSRKPERRFDFTVGVGNEVDLTRAQTLARATLARMDGVLDKPAPAALVTELGDSTVSIRILAWIDQRSADRSRVRSEAIRLVKEAFDREGISMPEPTYLVRTVPASDEPRPAPPAADDAPEQSTAPDRHLDREISAERESEEGDLLDPAAPKE